MIAGKVFRFLALIVWCVSWILPKKDYICGFLWVSSTFAPKSLKNAHFSDSIQRFWMSIFITAVKFPLKKWIFRLCDTVRRTQGRAQRSGLVKSGFWLYLLFVRSQISPLQAAPLPSGRDDKGANFNHNWYYNNNIIYPNSFTALDAWSIATCI